MLMYQKSTTEEKKKAEEMIRRAEQQGCHLSAQQVKDIGKKVAAEIKIEEHEERQRRAAANLNMIIRGARQRARVRAETQKEAKRDHFYDESQKVIDLTYLTYLIPEDAKLALSDDKFKTPISERILEVLSQTDRPDYQKVFLARITHKASYDDLRMIEASLKDKNLPHVMTKRRNPVRSKGYTHEDVKRHILARNSSAFVRQ